MQNSKKILRSIEQWWRGVATDNIYGMLMRWASIVTAVALVATTIFVILKGVSFVCSKKK